MTSTGRGAAVLGIAGVLLVGCAQPGQLGAALPAAVPVAATPTGPAPAPPVPMPAPPVVPAGPVLLGTGRLDAPVTLRTPGPAVLSVLAVTLPPGGTTGWHRRPGAEMSIVESGTVTLVRAERCATTRHPAGAAVFVPDAQAHLLRNDGTVPAELVTTVLLTPGAPDREDLPPRC